MPNWTENHVCITGPQNCLDELEAFVRTKPNGTKDQEVLDFDFNEIIPMPDFLDIESGSRVNRGIEAFEESPSQIEKMDPETRLLVRKAIINLRNYGFKDWYDWRISKWGCKWNVCDLYFDKGEGYLQYSFNTPWCGPFNICKTLREAFPELNIEWGCLNEEDCCCEEDENGNWICPEWEDNPNVYDPGDC